MPTPKSPSAPILHGLGATVFAVRSADPAPPILFERAGWGLSDFEPAQDPFISSNEGSVLTHIGCDCEFPSWHLATFLWGYSEDDEHQSFKCRECGEVLTKDSFDIFVKVYNLLNRAP